MNAPRAEAAALLASLSEREVEVFTRLARGDSTAQVARDLGLARSSAKTYRKRILQKLAVGTNADLVILGYRLGLARREER